MKFDITVLLDRSGSMQSRKDDHIGGLRSFIKDQKGRGPTDFTLVQFDSSDPFELVFDGVDIETVDEANVDLIPRGGTPLLDAVGKTVAHIENRVKDKEDVQAVLMIITDGGENQSREWNRERVQKAIKDKENDWKILYLGADVNDFDEAYGLGIGANAAINFANTSRGTEAAYRTGFSKLNNMRAAYTTGCSKMEALNSADYTAEDRQACADGNVDLTNNTWSSK